MQELWFTIPIFRGVISTLHGKFQVERDYYVQPAPGKHLRDAVSTPLARDAVSTRPAAAAAATS